MFPNPASEQLTLVSKAQSEVLSVVIKDLSGRTLLNKEVKTNEFIANLDLSLPNGAYLITITNNLNEITSKKLIVAK